MTEAPGIRLKGLVKRFHDQNAVDGVTFDVRKGEIVSLLGPSGCGKTTTLRMIGGLAEPTAGEIEILGREVTDLPAWERNCGFVFQSYALFPHMTVEQNIAYGLTLRKWDKRRVQTQVNKMAELLGIESLLKRRPKQLSGGQQQRVAVARALAIEPDVMLMDEPLANLDAKLREKIRFELRQIQRETGVTVLYVTHDQSEAFALSDRIVVMNLGKIEQAGSPQDIFSRPASTFVASFIGSNNLLSGRVDAWDGEAAELDWGGVKLRGNGVGNLQAGEQGMAIVRSQDWSLEPQEGGAPSEPAPHAPNVVRGRVEDLAFLGTHYRITVRASAGAVHAEFAHRDVDEKGIKVGDSLLLHADEVLVIPQ